MTAGAYLGRLPGLNKEKGRQMEYPKTTLPVLEQRWRVKSPLVMGTVLFGLLALAACGDNSKRPTFDGNQYRAKLTKVDKQRDQFSVTVTPVSNSLVGAREAGRFEATKYCIAQFGTSDIAWLSGPDAEDGELTITNDKLEFRGTCTP
jgi:hypothetical protein